MLYKKEEAKSLRRGNGRTMAYDMEQAKAMVIDTKDAKTRYKPGEEISFKGVKVTYGGEDVTGSCVFSVDEGTLWKASDTTLDVGVSLPTPEVMVTGTFTLKKKKSVFPILLIPLGLLSAGLAGWFIASQPKPNQFPEGDTGTYMIPQGEMTDEEAQQLVNDMAERSRITVSLAPEMALKEDGSLRVNLVVPEGNNGLSERVEVEQDGKVVYQSGVVRPGNRLEWGNGTQGAHAGSATATVYAISDDADFGNPVSVEVTITEA